MRALAALALLLGIVGAACAQAFIGGPQPMVPYATEPGPNIPGGWPSGPMVPNSVGPPPPPPTPCSVGQLDFSDGCNTTLYMVLLR